LTYSLGNATNRWNGEFGTVTATTIGATNLTFSSATGVSLNLTNTLYINTIAINATGTTSTNSGAWLIGVFDEFTFSNATNVQQALRDLDLAIGNVTTTEVDTFQTVTNRGNSTTNTIQFAGGTSTQDFYMQTRGTAGMYDARATKLFNVLGGVGQPAELLIDSVDGSGDGQSAYLTINGDTSGGGDTSIALLGSGTTYGIISAGTDTFSIQGLNGANIGIGTNSISNIFIEAVTGNIGIGTNAPTSTFHIFASAPNNPPLLTLEQQFSEDVQIFIATSSPNGAIMASRGDLALGTDGRLYIKEVGNGTNTGWVGVATVDMVASSTNITAGNGLTASGTEIILGGVLYQDTTIDGNGGAFDLIIQDVKSFDIGGGGVGATGSLSNTDLVFTGTDGFFIRTPNYLTAATGSVLTLTDPLSGRVEFTSGIAGVDTLQNVTDRGNVTTNTIQFAGATSVGDILPGANLTYSLGSTSSRWSQLFAATVYVGSSTWALAQNADQSFMLSGPAGQARMTVDANGNVAFGVATATSRLHVSSASTSTTPILTLENSGGSIQQFVVQASPEGVVTGSIGDLAIDSSNGLLYIKNTGIATTNGWLSLLTSVSNTLQSAYNGGGIALGRFVTTTSGLPTTFIAGSSTLDETIFRMRDKQNANDVFGVATRDDDAGNELSVLTLSDGDNAGLGNSNRIQQIASSGIFGIFGSSNATDQTVFSVNGEYGLLLTSSPTGQIHVSSGGGASSTRFNMKKPGVPFIDLADPLATVSIFTTKTDPNGNFIASLGSLALNYGNGALHINVDGADTWSTLLTDDNDYYRYGGNSFGTLGIFGTADTNDLSIITDGNEAIHIDTAGNIQFSGYGAGTLTTDIAGNITALSDSRLKIDRGNFSRGLSAVLGLEPKLYNWTATSGLDTSTVYAGFYSQNVKEFIPEAVDTDPNGYLSLSDRPILASVVNAIKEQQGMIMDLESRVSPFASPSLTVVTSDDDVNIFVATTTFTGALIVKERVNFGRDTVGQAKMLPGSTLMRVRFVNAYDKQPIVNITPIGLKSIDYGVENITTEGFDIAMRPEQAEAILFNWIAFGAQDGVVTVSDGTTSTIEIIVGGTLAPAISTDTGVEPPTPPAAPEMPTSTPEIIPEPELPPEPAPEVTSIPEEPEAPTPAPEVTEELLPVIE